MDLTPRQGLDGGVDDVGAVFAHLEDAGHRESGTAVAVVLDDDFRMLGLDHADQFAQHGRLSDTCHVLETDFRRTRGDELLGDVGIVLRRVNRAGRDAERCLRRHPAFEGIVDGGDDVAHVVQSAEDTRDVHTLCVLHLVHQTTDVGRYGEHAQRVQTTVEHMRLDAGLVEGACEGTHGLVRVLTVQQVDLFEGAAVGFDTCKAAHLDDDGCDAFQLVLSRLEFSARLEHVSVNETELNLSLLHFFGNIFDDLAFEV